MICIGKIESSVLKSIIRPAYKSYHDINYDLSKVKDVLVYYVRMHFQDPCFDLPINIVHYKLNKSIVNKFKLDVIGSNDLSFFISTKSGKIYLYY